MLSPWRDLHRYIAIQSLDGQLRTKDGLADREEEFGVDVGTFSPEVAVRLHFYMDDQITGRRAVSSMTFLRHSQVHAIVNSFGDANRLGNLRVVGASASASDAGTFDY